MLIVALLALLVPAAPAAALSKAALAGKLRALMAQAGATSGAYVEDLAAGEPLYSRRSKTGRIPASNQKLYTSVAALAELGAGATLSTTALATVPIDLDGTLDGNLYLRGGGDPSLSTAGLEVLAQDLADAGLSRVTGRVIGDESAFDRRRGTAATGYAPNVDLAPLGALMVNRGYDTGGYQANPPRFAATTLARQLRDAGVRIPTVKGRAGRTPPGALALATHRSPTVTSLIKSMNVPSDNYIAEMLLKAVGRSDELAGTTARGAAVAEDVADDELGANPQIADGSGLSRADRTSPRDVVALLRAEFEDPAFFGSLAVMGVSGTLQGRLRSSVARRRCRGKTGTLSDVSALSGYCRLRDGGTVAYSMLMNRVSPYGARRIQDRMVSVIARYSG